MVHVEDVIAGYLAALTRGTKGERYILGGENIPFSEFLQEIARVVGAPPLRLRPPGWFFNRLAGIADRIGPMLRVPVRGHLFRMVGRHFYYDTLKAQRELGVHAQKSALEAIQAAHQWYLKHPDLVRR